MLGSCLCQCPGTVSQCVYGCSVPQEFSVKQNERIGGLMDRFLDDDFRRSLWPSLRCKSVVGAFWQITSFVPQCSFYKREKTIPAPPHCFPFPHSCFQQSCLIACFCSRDCLSFGIAVVPARRSGLHALSTVWAMLVYTAVDTK